MSFFRQVDALVAKFQAHRAALRATAEDTGHSLKLWTRSTESGR